MEEKRLVDLSHVIDHGMVTYQGLPGPHICDFWTREGSAEHYDDGSSFQIGRIDMVANTGTYLDAPFHRYAQGDDLAALELARLASLPGLKVTATAQAVDADAPMALDLSAWPFEGWDELPGRVNGKRPRQVPFFDFEYWMYARILQVVRYAERRRDPFRNIKHDRLERHLRWADEALGRTTTLAAALNLSLDANAHDLSQLSGPAQSHEFGRDIFRSAAEDVRRLNIITDNFGGEFVADLVLGIVAAETGIEVVYHLKQLPIFVSDTTDGDVAELLNNLNDDAFGVRLRRAVSSGRLSFASHWFWAAPQFLDALPRDACTTQAADELFGLAREHRPADDFDLALSPTRKHRGGP